MTKGINNDLEDCKQSHELASFLVMMQIWNIVGASCAEKNTKNQT